MGAQYYELLADRTTLLLQLQGFAACGDPEVRELVRTRLGRMWETVAETTGLDPVTIKSFLAFGMLLNNVAALDVDELDEPWAEGCAPGSSPGCSSTSLPPPTPSRTIPDPDRRGGPG